MPATATHVRLAATLVTLTVMVVASSTAASVYVAGDPGRHALVDHAAAPRASNYAAILQLVDSLSRPRVAVRRAAHDADDVAVARNVDPDAAHHVVRGSHPEARRAAGAMAVDTASSLYTMQPRAMQQLRSLVVANEAAIDSALATGDVLLAMEHARANLAMSRWYLQQPALADLSVGRWMVQRAAFHLTRSARAAGDSATMHAAIALADAARLASALGPDMASVVAMAGDPRRPVLHQLAADRSMPPAVRVEAALTAAVTGLCMNTREVLMGASAERRELVERIGLAVADIPDATQLVALAGRTLDWYDHLDAATVRAAGIEGDAPERRALVTGMLTSGVRSRVRVCRAKL